MFRDKFKCLVILVISFLCMICLPSSTINSQEIITELYCDRFLTSTSGPSYPGFFNLVDLTQPQILWLLGNTTQNYIGLNPSYNLLFASNPSNLEFQQSNSILFPGIVGNTLSTSTFLNGSLSLFTVGLFFSTTSTNGGMLLNTGDLPYENSYYVPFAIYLDKNGYINTFFWITGIYSRGYAGTVLIPKSNYTYNDGHTHMVVYTVSANLVSLYIDNVETLTLGTGAPTEWQTFSGNNAFSSSFFMRVGGDSLQHIDTTGANYYFNGLINNVFLIPTTLTSSQVQTIYTAGSNLATVILAFTPYLYWTLSQSLNSQNIITDASPNSNNGIYYITFNNSFSSSSLNINNEVANSLFFPGGLFGSFITPNSNFYATQLLKSFTIGIWFNTPYTLNGNLMKLTSTNNMYNYSVDLNHLGQIVFNVVQSSTIVSSITSSSIFNNGLNNLVFITETSTQICLYTNQIVSLCNNVNNNIPLWTINSLTFGGHSTTNSFTGFLGPILVYNYDVSPAFIFLFFQTLNASIINPYAINNTVIANIMTSPVLSYTDNTAIQETIVFEINYDSVSGQVMDFSDNDIEVEWEGFTVIEAYTNEINIPPTSFFENYILTTYSNELLVFLPCNDPVFQTSLRDISNHNHIGNYYPNGPHDFIQASPPLLPGFIASVFLGGGNPNPNTQTSVYTTGNLLPVTSFSLEIYFSTTTTAGGGIITGTDGPNGFIGDGPINGISYGYANVLWMTTSGKLQTGFYNEYTTPTTKSYNDGQPHQAVVTFSTSTPYVVLYVDGLVQASLLTQAYVAVVQSSISIGYGDGNYWPSGYGWEGFFSDLIVYQIALNASQVLNNYQAALNPLNANYTSVVFEETCRTSSRGAIICNDTSFTISNSFIGLDDWSLSFWISVNNSLTDTSPFYWMIIENFVSIFPWSIGNVIIPTIPSTFINNWSLIVFTFHTNTQTLSVYWNNVLVFAEITAIPIVIPTTWNILLNNCPFNMYVDNITLYTSTLSNEFITQMYTYSMGIENFQILNLQMTESGNFVNLASNNSYPQVQFVNNSYKYVQPNWGCGYAVNNEAMSLYTTNLVGFAYSNGVQNLQLELPLCSSYSMTLWVWFPSMIMRLIDNPFLFIVDYLQNVYPVHFGFYGNVFEYYANYGYAIESEKWTHVAVTYANDRNDFYVDGQLVFSYLAYTVPVPNPYLSGFLQITPSVLVFSNIALYCTSLSQDQVNMDMTYLANPEIKIPAYPAADLSTYLDSVNLPLPNYTFPVPLDKTDYIAGFFGIFVTEEEVAQVSNIISDEIFTHFYIDQINGNDNNNGLTWQTAWATPNNINSINLQNTLGCVDIEFCYGDKFYNQQQLNIPTISSPTCPLIMKPNVCPNRPITNGNNANGNKYTLLSGLNILPQITGVIGWKNVTNYPTLGGLNLAAYETILSYNLSLLWQLQGNQNFLSVNPLFFNDTGFHFQPIVLNTMYNTPRFPNLIDPIYPYGKTLSDSLPSYNVAGFSLAGENDGTQSCKSTIMPGAWCLATYVNLFKFNQTAYDQYFYYTNAGNNFMNGALVLGKMTDELSYVPNGESGTVTYKLSQGMQMNSSNYFNCSLWYQTDVAPTGITWEDPTLIELGVSYERIGTSGYQIPGAWSGGPVSGFDFTNYFFPGYAYYDFSLGNDGTSNNACSPMDITYSATLVANSGPPFGGGYPNGSFTGGTACGKNPQYLLVDCTTCFDAPGEYWYQNGTLYLIPWNTAHATSLLTTSNAVTLNMVNISQSHYITKGWATVHNYDKNYAISNPTINSNVLIQEFDISGYAKWGINIAGVGNVAILNVTVTQCAQAISTIISPGYTGMIVNTSAINQTLFSPARTLNGENVAASSGACFWCGSSGSNNANGMCGLINSTCFFSDNWNQWDFARNIQIINSVSNGPWQRNGRLWRMEHSLINQTNFYWADSGSNVNARSANPWVLVYSTFDGNAQGWRNGFPPTNCNTYGATKGNAGYVDYWLNGYSGMLHGNFFYNSYTGITGGNDGALAMGVLCCSGWNADNYWEFSSNVVTQGYEAWFGQGPFNFDLGILCNGTQSQQRPAVPISGYARPMTLTGNLAMWDGFVANGNVMPFTFPYFWPSPQTTSPLWRWSEPNAFTGYVVNTTFAYATVKYRDENGNSVFTNLTFNSSYLYLEDGFPLFFDGAYSGGSIANTILNTAMNDIENILLSNGNNPLPILGAENSANIQQVWETTIENEAWIQSQYSEPAIWAIFQTLTGYYFPPNSTSSYILNEELIYGFEASTPSTWPNVTMQSFTQNQCTSTQDCSYSLQMNLMISPQTGITNDKIYSASPLTQCSNPLPSTVPVGLNNGNPGTNKGYNFNGNSWDNVFGLVWDGTMTNGGVPNFPNCLINWAPILSTYTVSWFVWNAVYQQAGGYAVNDCNYSFLPMMGQIGFGGWTFRVQYMENPAFGGCVPIPMYQSVNGYPQGNQDCMTWFSVNTDTSAQCGAGYNPLLGVGQQAIDNAIGYPCQGGCSSYGYSYPNVSSFYGSWSHFAFSANSINQQVKFYINGKYQWTVPNLPVSVIGGGPTVFGMINSNKKWSNFQIYSGQLTDQAVNNIYTSQTNGNSSYNGPNYYNAIISTSGNLQLLFNLSYNSSTNTFWNGNIYAPAVVAAIGVTTATNNLVNLNASDPVTPSTIVITNSTAVPYTVSGTNYVLQNPVFVSIASPLLSHWNLTFSMYFTALPSSATVFWFGFPTVSLSTNRTFSLMFFWTSNNQQLCVANNVYQPASQNIAIYSTSSCFTALSSPLSLNQWYSFTIIGSDAAKTLSFYVQNTLISTLSSLTSMSLIMQNTLYFYPLEFLWNFAFIGTSSRGPPEICQQYPSVNCYTNILSCYYYLKNIQIWQITP